MRRASYLLTVVAFLLLGVTAARADVIFIDTFFLGSPLGDPSAELTFILTNYGATNLTFLAKKDKDATPPWSGDYKDYFSVSGLGTNTGTISWNLTGAGYTLGYILLKDGNVKNSGQLYTLYGVTTDQKITSNGDQNVVFVNENPPPVNIDKGISHISFFGSEAPVPEPATLLLLGAGLAGVGFACRKRL